MNNPTKTIRYFLILCTILVVVSCQGKKQASQNDTPQEQLLVRTMPVVSENLEQIQEFTGTIDAAVKNFISSAGSARIHKIYVNIGDGVQQGQTLVEMESTNYLNAQAQLENLRSEYQRIETLYRSGGVSKQTLDQVKTQLEVSEKNTKNLSENTILKSPINGVVTLRNFDAGDLSGSQPILQVMQINPVKVKINISELFFHKVKIGTPVDVRLDVYENESFHGKISLIAPVVDPISRTFMCEVSIANAHKKIRPGMFARVSMHFGKKDLLVVPDKAVLKQAGSDERYVYIYKDGIAKRQVITIGNRDQNNYIVFDGLQKGDEVIVDGQNKLQDGSTVSLAK